MLGEHSSYFIKDIFENELDMNILNRVPAGLQKVLFLVLSF